jgi:ubiquitin carboxyl-terminal hydrolase 6/32
VWTVEAQLPRDFARLVFELCHVVLGLRPATRRDEADIVRGWLEREEAAGFWPGQVCVFMITTFVLRLEFCGLIV